MVDPSTSRSVQVACAAAIKKNDKENRRIYHEVQIEEPYPGENGKGKDGGFRAMNKFIVRWE